MEKLVSLPYKYPFIVFRLLCINISYGAKCWNMPKMCFQNLFENVKLKGSPKNFSCFIYFCCCLRGNKHRRIWNSKPNEFVRISSWWYKPLRSDLFHFYSSLPLNWSELNWIANEFFKREERTTTPFVKYQATTRILFRSNNSLSLSLLLKL